MAKKKGTTSGEEGVLELGFEYDDTGEKAAIQGAENVTKAVTSLGAESKKTSVDLSSISTQLANTKKATNDLTKEQQVLGEVIASLEQKAKKSADSIRDLVKAGTSKGKTTSYTDINRAIAGSTGINPKAFKAIDPVTSQTTKLPDITDRLKQIKSITPQVNDAFEAQKKLNDAINKHTVAAVKNIEKLNTTEEQMKEVGSALVTVSAAITQNTKLTSDADTVMKNHSKNLDSYTKLVDGEDVSYARLKTTVVDYVNKYGALDTLTRKQTTNFKDQKTALEGIKRILTEKQKLETQIANTKDDQQKIELLRQQEILLEGAKDNYIALAAKAKDYSNELKIISTLNLKGFKYTPGDTPFTASQSEVQGVMTIASKDFDILKKNTDARKSSTAAIMDEANAIKQASAGRNDYDNMLEENEASLAILKTTLSENQSVLRGVGTLYSTVAKDVKTYTKHIDESDIATLDLTSKTTVLNKQFTDSRTNLREQTRTLRDQINAQKEYSAELKEAKRRQDELNASREKSRLSSEAVTAVSGVKAPITSATNTLATRVSASGIATAQAKEFYAAALAAENYEMRIFDTDNALGVLSSALRLNREALASTKLEMVTVTDVLKEHMANLDMDSIEAKELSDVIQGLEEQYADTRLELEKSNAAISSRIGAIQEEKKQTVTAYAAIEKAEQSKRDKEAETLRIAKENNATWQKILNTTGRSLMRLGRMWSMYITAPLVAAAVQAVKFTATMEMNIKSLGILLHGNAEAAEELYTQVTRYAAETPYEIPDLTAATKQLLAFGSASGDVLHELSMLGDLAQNDAEKLNSVVSAFGKVQARGVAHMRELNRFIMAGVPIIEKLGVVMNKSSDQLFKAVEQGQVSFAAVKQALESLTSEGERFHNMSEKLASTVQGRYSTMSDELNLALKKFADDYMDNILKLLEGIIDIARAIQSMSKPQRDILKTSALIFAITGPLLITIGAIVTLVALLQKYTSVILIKMGLINISATMLSLILTGIGAVIGLLSFAAFYTSVKKGTEAFVQQKNTILDVVSAINKLKQAGNFSDALLNSYAKSLQAQVAPYVELETIKDMLRTEPENSLVAKLTELNSISKVTAESLAVLELQLKNVKESAKNPQVARYMGDPEKLIKLIQDRIDALKQETTKKTTKLVDSENFADFLKKKLNVVALAGETDNIADILNHFKYNTEEAISGTIEQFGRFVGVIPDLEEARTAFAEAVSMGYEGLAAKDTDTGKSGFASLLEKYKLSADYGLGQLLNELVVRPKDFDATVKSITETFDSLEKFTTEAIKSYIDATKASFEIDNIADILVEKAAGKPDSTLIKQRADALKEAYVNLIQTAIREIIKENPSRTFEKALDIAKIRFEDLFTQLDIATKTVDVAKSNDSYVKLVEEYSTAVATLGMTEVGKFNAEVDALLANLAGSDYYAAAADSIDQLKKNFGTIQFDEVERSLIDQKNALVLTADAYQALTYKQKGFTKEQTASLVTLQKFNDTLTALKGISDSFASGTSLSGDFGKIADSYGVASKTIDNSLTTLIPDFIPKSTQKLVNFEKAGYSMSSKPTTSGRVAPSMPTIPGAELITDSISLSTERTKAINAMANAYIRADEATRKLTESSQQYKDFMAKVDKGTWDAAKSTALLSLAKEQLITNDIEIANNGKDTNEIQLEFWQSIKNSIAPTDAFNTVLDELILSYQSLIELGTDKEKLTALPDAIKDMREEIAAFSRTPAEAIQAEIFAKKSELMQAAADDLGTSLEVLGLVMAGRIPASSDAMSTAIALIQSNMVSFVDFMKNKALKGLQDTAAEYALQLANIGKTPRDILGAELKAAFIKDGGIVTEAVEDQIESILKAFDAIEQSKVDTSVADDLAKIRLEIAQLSMSDLGKTIDNITREGEAANKTAEQIKEQIDATKELYALKEGIKTTDEVNAKIKELDTTVSQFGMSEDEKVIAWAKDLYTNGKIAKTTLDDLIRSLGALSIKAAGMNFSALLTGLNTEAKTVGMSAEDKFMYDNKEIIDAEKTARLKTAAKSGALNYGTVASITASVDTEARGQFRETATATSAAEAKAQLDTMQASWKETRETAGMSELGVGLREIERLGAIAGTSAEDIIKLKDEFKKMTKEVAFKDLSKSIGVDILNTALSETVNQIEKIGEAWSAGTLNAQSFGDAIGNISIALVNALPQLLLSAGLNLLTTNPSMWAIALGLIAASGIAALGKGAMNDKMNANVDGTTSAASTISYSAKGNAFDRGNIITSPTLLTGKNGLNVGGELGTEAIMPLSRDSSGRLGITSSGGGANVAVSVPVSVTVINQTGVEAETETKRTTNADGSQNIEIMVKKLVNKGIASGEYDRSMTTRYGVKNKGIA